MKKSLPPDDLGTTALLFVLNDPALAEALMAASGLDPARLRSAVQTPEFGDFALDFIAEADDRVRAFALAQGEPPERMAQRLHARRGYD